MQNHDLASEFLDLSPYLASPADLREPLEQDIEADVAIVGGGLTGLSAALALRRDGLKTVVLERDFCGFGASGRNAGHLTPTIGKDIPTLLMMYGREHASRLVRFADHCVLKAEQMISELGIDCDYIPSGNIMSVVHPRQEARLRKATDVAQQLGASVRFLEPGDMRERGIPPAFLGGALEGAGGTLHPGRFVSGLRRAALDAGVSIFEQATVLEVKDGTSAQVRTESGTVAADRVLMANNAYQRELGKPGGKVWPLYVTMFQTEPLNDAQIDAIGGWPGREGIYTAHESLESYRLTAQRTIIGGAKGVRYVYGRKPCDGGGPDDRSQSIVATAFRDRFPQLADVGIAHFWGGWIAMTMNFLPTVGRSRSGKVYHAMGYNGHGVAQASTVGAILADMVQERDNEWQDLIRPSVLPMLPEPLGWLFVNGILAVLNGIDRRIDRQARAL